MYDIKTNTWSSIAPLPERAINIQATVLSNGKVSSATVADLHCGYLLLVQRSKYVRSVVHMYNLGSVYQNIVIVFVTKPIFILQNQVMQPLGRFLMK